MHKQCVKRLRTHTDESCNIIVLTQRPSRLRYSKL